MSALGRRLAGLSLPLLCLAAAQSNDPHYFDIVPGGEQDVRQLDSIVAQRDLAIYARCLVDKRSLRGRIARFVRLLPGDAGMSGDRALLEHDCMRPRLGTTRLSFPVELLRSALFTALYAHDFAASPPSGDLAGLPPLRLSDEFERPVAEIPDAFRALRAIGDCAARADAVAVHTLILTTIGSEQERAAVAAVMPALANCVPEDRQIRFSRTMLRGILSEALYKLRTAASGPAPRP